MASQKRPRPAPLAILRGHLNPITSTLFLNHATDTHRYLLSADDGGTLRLWDTQYEDTLLTLSSPDRTPIISVLQPPQHSDRVIVQHKNGRLFNLFLSHNPFVADGHPAVWRVPDARSPFLPLSESHKSDPPLGHSFCRACVLPDTRIAGVSDDNRVLELHDHRTSLYQSSAIVLPKHFGMLMSLTSTIVPTSLSASGSDAHRLLVGAENGSIALVDLRTHNIVTQVTTSNSPVLALCPSPSSRVAVAAGAGNSIFAIADISAQSHHPLSVIQQVSLRREGIADIRWAHNGRFIFTAGWDSVVRVWNGRRTFRSLLNPILSLRWHDGSVGSITPSVDNALLASGGKDGTIALWNLKL